MYTGEQAEKEEYMYEALRCLKLLVYEALRC
jgi:hypothetical protein